MHGLPFHALPASRSSCVIALEEWVLPRDFVKSRPPKPSKITENNSQGIVLGTFNKRGVTERGIFAFACQYIVSPHGRTGNRTVTQMRHTLPVTGRPNCALQSLASILAVLALPPVYTCPILGVPKLTRSGLSGVSERYCWKTNLLSKVLSKSYT